VCCAGAHYVISRIDENLLAEVREKSDYVFSALHGAEGINSVTGKGLMIGIETVKPAAEVLKTCMQNGVLCLTAKTKLRLLPALSIPKPLLQEAVAVILDACK